MGEVRKNIFGNHHFLVYVDNVRIGFSKIGNIENSIEMEEFTIGGINHSPYFCISPKKGAGKLILDRGICGQADEVRKWEAGCQLENGLIIFIKEGSTQKMIKCYCISWGIITKWETSQLDSMGNEILINKFEVIHSGIIESEV